MAEAEGGPANVYVDFERAIASVANVTEEALRRAGLSGRESSVALGLGLAGISTAQDARHVEGRFARFAYVKAENDAVIACLGAHGGADGAIVIAGTGTAAMARVQGRTTIIGGRGFIVGDDGSGARIGLECLRAVAKAADGIGLRSSLTDAVLAKFDGDLVKIVNWAATARPGDFGSLAPIVLDHALRGDLVAKPIVTSAVAAIGALAAAVRGLGAPRVALVGGLGTSLRPFFTPDLQTLLEEPAADPLEGAILLAASSRGLTE